MNRTARKQFPNKGRKQPYLEDGIRASHQSRSEIWVSKSHGRKRAKVRAKQSPGPKWTADGLTDESARNLSAAQLRGLRLVLMHSAKVGLQSSLFKGAQRTNSLCFPIQAPCRCKRIFSTLLPLQRKGLQANRPLFWTPSRLTRVQIYTESCDRWLRKSPI